MSDDLAAFVAARLEEDEAAAKACQSPVPWKSAEHESDTWIVTDACGEPVVYDEGTPTLEEARHIARHDPARVLREVAAKRAILAEHQVSAAGVPLSWCATCHRERPDAREDEEQCAAVDWPCPTLRALAAAWSDHPDFRAEWKPYRSPSAISAALVLGPAIPSTASPFRS